MKPDEKRRVKVNDRMQSNYVYFCTEPIGKNFNPEFQPELTPKEMLELGVFGGKYMTDCVDEFPASWFRRAKLCSERHDPKLNYFRVNASVPLSVWRRRAGSITKIRAAGFNGIAAITWAAVVPTTSGKSNAGARCVVTSRRSKKHCPKGEAECRPRQRQALLTGLTTHERSNRDQAPSETRPQSH